MQATLPLTDGGVLRWKSRAGATYQFGRWLLPPRKVSPGDPDSESNVDQRVQLRMQGKEEMCRAPGPAAAGGIRVRRGGDAAVPPGRKRLGRARASGAISCPRAGRRRPQQQTQAGHVLHIVGLAQQADHEGPVTPQANRLAAALATPSSRSRKSPSDPNGRR